MLGPDKPIDTNRWFVICANALGSCKGSTGPASSNPDNGERYRLAFPELSIEDGASAAHALVIGLGIKHLACLIGNSMGGMAALAYIHRFPGHARRSEEHTSELQSLMRISYAVFCLKKKKKNMITNK